MPTHAVLSFEISSAPFVPEDSRAGEGQHLSIEVTPVLDGVAFPNLGVFDAVDMLLYGATDAETDLYTCSCGNAGCAGFHEYVQLRASSDTMSWQFPEEPYRAGLSPERFPLDAPLHITFNKSQYIQALAKLEADLEQLFESSALPAVVVPRWSCEQSNAKTFKGMLKAARKRRLKWDAECRARAEALGALSEFQYVARLPNGWVLFAGMSAVAWEQVGALNLADAEELAEIRNTIGPRLLAEQVTTILNMAVPERCRTFYGEGLGLADAEWLTAIYEVVTNEEAAALNAANREKNN